ncbi:protein of unknown function [Taphrina deformans PYCC 5710]|uniref:Peroxin 20 n=1 Tax=Taphrina deformans (strain PYCC 5710 / ATCC 11124 / CBS 356.35 / IMI 108563 / JCM 9778 / NBRC 8474) TaxID=1097556 RepID=R4XEW6_TAPDE|nr:protein of unknown function [Taphrina deformans PYCC 5710]|eukprot:CCG84407.1 protein of unknown function [Taphrina deformans PYCC 5710]
MDASCGPSNGIKSLQRHFDSDQSLHQSRVHQGHVSNPSFRQAPTQEQINQANQEQYAFLNAPRPDSFLSPGAAHPHSQSQLQPQHRPLMQGSSWAQDFHHALPAVHQIPASHTQRQGTWGAEFLATTRQGQGQGQGPVPYIAAPGQAGTLAANRPVFLGHPTLFDTPVPGESVSGVQAPDQSFADAFAEAEAALLEHRAAEAEVTDRDLVGLTSDQRDLYNQDQEMALMDGLVTDRLRAVESQEATERRFEGDALATTAGDLIHNMRDERSEKFRNSNFMALMHKLRDREVVVDNGKMIDAVSREEVSGHQTRDIDALVSRQNQLQDVVLDE